MTSKVQIDTDARAGYDVLTGDARRAADAIVAKYPSKRSATLPLLFLVQSIEGYVTEQGMREVARLLDLTPAEVLASCSFYTMLKKNPQGDYLISVCRNITCTHRGAARVVAALEQRLGVGVGETTRDGMFTLETAECLATCDGAPSLQVNYEDFYSVTPEAAVDLVDRLQRGDPVDGRRGDRVRTSKVISYETAIAGAATTPARGHGDADPVGGESAASDLAPGGGDGMIPSSEDPSDFGRADRQPGGSA